MATNLDQFGQYLQQLYPHCKNGLSQMECRNAPLWACDHWKFLEYFSDRTASGMMFGGLFFIQKDFVAVMFTGSPFNHVKSKVMSGTCVAPMYTFLEVWSVAQTSIVQQSEGSHKQTYTEAERSCISASQLGHVYRQRSWTLYAICFPLFDIVKSFLTLAFTTILLSVMHGMITS